MIAIDTNILLRYFVGDDPDQSERARRFIEERLTVESPGFVAIVAVVELAWVLERSYGASARVIAEVLRELLDAAQIVIERQEILEAALAHPRQDIADALLHELGKSEGCEKTVTFDRRFARLDGVELLA